MGYTEREFRMMTPRYFHNAVRGCEDVRREKWEQTRYQAYLSILPHVDRKKKLKVTDLGRFPWEGEEPASQSIQERKGELLGKLKQWQAEAAAKKGAEK